SGETNWLRLEPTSGFLQKEQSKDVLVRVESSGLAVGTYSATLEFKITVSSGDTDTKKAYVTLTVSQSEPHKALVRANPSSLTFTSTWGKAFLAVWEVTLTNCDPNDSWTEFNDDGTSLAISPSI